MQCLSLGGLEVSPQLERLGLKTGPQFFDGVVVPTASLPKLLDDRLGDAFERERLEILNSSFDLHDEKYDVTVTGAYEPHRTIHENLCNLAGRFAFRRKRFRDDVYDPMPALFFHEATGDVDLHAYFDVLASVRKMRRDAPYHLVFVTATGEDPANQEHVSFYRRPADVDAATFWGRLVEDLRARGKLSLTDQEHEMRARNLSPSVETLGERTAPSSVGAVSTPVATPVVVTLADDPPPPPPNSYPTFPTSGPSGPA